MGRLRGIVDGALQLVLPLFDPAPDPRSVPAPAAPPATPSGSRAAAPPAGPPQGDDQRHALLRGERIAYTLRRSRRRTIGFTIDDRGLTVAAPRWVGQREIDAALVERGDWIVRKLVDWRDYTRRRERTAIRWEDGAALPFLGRTLRLRVDAGHRGKPRLTGDELHLGLPPQAGADQLRDRVQSWLQQRAREHFAERIAHFAREHGVTPTRWALSSARTRWGSCGADGAIRLNWRLMHFPPEIVDYVIAHELAHLRELNHGPRFWSTVGELFPDWQRARAWLRKLPDDAAL
jgi:predicted metal-dependent hydrolase